MRAHRDALLSERSGLRPLDFDGIDLETWIGRVEGIDEVRLPARLQDYECRNNRLALRTLETDGFAESVRHAISEHGSSRIGLFIGTSTSGIQEAELAYTARASRDDALPSSFRYNTTQAVFSIAAFVRELLGLRGPAEVVSTACSSSAKVFAVAHRFMSAGFCDAAIVGGVDSLCRMTLYGFNSLQLVSERPCRPSDRDRNGLTIGEAAGFALLEWQDGATGVCLLGYGESSDAWHLSTPDPSGAGAMAAIRQALASARLEPAEIDYVNLHGTATAANDLAEDAAVFGIFDGCAPCSSTKGFTGHTLGAAGIVEALISSIAIEDGVSFRSLNTVVVDDAIRSPILLQTIRGPIANVMTNSFGFGGSNTTLILGKGS
jgi:3-oxoacyl-[acyl-carrier-protein] synthase-1